MWATELFSLFRKYEAERLRKSYVKNWGHILTWPLIILQMNCRNFVFRSMKRKKTSKKNKMLSKISKTTENRIRWNWKRRDRNCSVRWATGTEGKSKFIFSRICLILRMKNGKMRSKDGLAGLKKVWLQNRHTLLMQRKSFAGCSSLKKLIWSIVRRFKRILRKRTKTRYIKRYTQKADMLTGAWNVILEEYKNVRRWKS